MNKVREFSSLGVAKNGCVSWKMNINYLGFLVDVERADQIGPLVPGAILLPQVNKLKHRAVLGDLQIVGKLQVLRSTTCTPTIQQALGTE